MQVARSGGPKRALPWSPKRILPERPRPGNPPGPLLDGERLHAEEVPERGGVGCVAYPVEEGEQAYDIPDRGEESSRQPHREERRGGDREPLFPGSRGGRGGPLLGGGGGGGGVGREGRGARLQRGPQEVHVALVLHGLRIPAPWSGGQNRIDAGATLDGGRQSVGLPHVADHRLRSQRAQVLRLAWVAHQRADLVAGFEEVADRRASDPTRRPRYQYSAAIHVLKPLLEEFFQGRVEACRGFEVREVPCAGERHVAGGRDLLGHSTH